METSGSWHEMRVVRWDLDQTYLQTDIQSLRGLWRAAFEDAADKRTVAGATALVKALSLPRNGVPTRVEFLSGSPEQMRPVIEEKLRLDGIHFDVVLLKDNLKNLKSGRFRALRGQFSYKLPKLLEGRLLLPPHAREYLFGDDTEVDAVVYSLYADILSGIVAPADLARILEVAGAYPDHVVDALSATGRLRRDLPPTEGVAGIFIRRAHGRPKGDLSALRGRVVQVDHWFEAAIALYTQGQLDVAAVEAVLAESHLPDERVLAGIDALLREGTVDPSALVRLTTAATPGPLWEQLALRLADAPSETRPPAPPQVDYVSLLRRLKR